MKQEKIGIIGLGYVGLPLAMVFAESGFSVIGFDVNNELCNKLNSRESHIKDISNERLSNSVINNKFRATTDFSELKNCDCISICVPTPLNKIKDPDLSFVISASESIAKYLRKEQLIILESTTYPGTTKDIVLPILSQNTFSVGKDFYLCFSPERVDPGNQKWTTKNTPKVIGGITESCLIKGEKVYGKVFDRLVKVQNTEAAELVKVYENTFRMINIALANELSLICDTLNLNVWNIIEAASTKPFGFMKFSPGPGLGGHCIPLDPHYLSWKMRTLEFKTKMIEIASEINAGMPNNIVNKIGSLLNSISKSFKNSKILIVGVAYKKDIDDLRESPALKIIELLEEKQSKIYYHDPYCSTINVDKHLNIKNLPMYSVDLDLKFLKDIDVAVIVTDHSNINYELIMNNCEVIDTRGVLNKFTHI
jgi:UDP-N-acetyl-D-glucosamine dehydrogenase